LKDFAWAPCGSWLVDAAGDLAETSNVSLESEKSLIESILKASAEDWKLYPVGAGLEELIGSVARPELEVVAERRVMEAIRRTLLGDFTYRPTVTAFLTGNVLDILVFFGNQKIAAARVSQEGVQILDPAR